MKTTFMFTEKECRDSVDSYNRDMMLDAVRGNAEKVSREFLRLFKMKNTITKLDFMDFLIEGIDACIIPDDMDIEDLVSEFPGVVLPSDVLLMIENYPEDVTIAVKGNDGIGYVFSGTELADMI